MGKTEKELWKIVYAAETIEEIDKAIEEVRISDVDNNVYNELMRTLSYLRIESIQRKRNKNTW